MLGSWVATTPLAQPEPPRGSGFVSKDNRNKAAAPVPKFNPVVARNMQDPTGQYMWLFSGMK